MYTARKTLLTGTDILTDTSQARLDTLFACPDHADVHTTRRIYQDLLATYRDRDPRRSKNTLRQLITTLTRPGLPHTCIQLARIGTTLKHRARNILTLSSPGFCVGIFRPLSFVLLCICFLLVAV